MVYPANVRIGPRFPLFKRKACLAAANTSVFDGLFALICQLGRTYGTGPSQPWRLCGTNLPFAYAAEKIAQNIRGGPEGRGADLRRCGMVAAETPECCTPMVVVRTDRWFNDTPQYQPDRSMARWRFQIPSSGGYLLNPQ